MSGRHVATRSPPCRPGCPRHPLRLPFPALAGTAPDRRPDQGHAVGHPPHGGRGLLPGRRRHRRAGRRRRLRRTTRARGRPDPRPGRGDRRRRHHAAPHRRHQLDLRGRPGAAPAVAQDPGTGLAAHPAGRGGRGRRGEHRRRREDRLVRRGAGPLRLLPAGDRRRHRRPAGVPARAGADRGRGCPRTGPGGAAVAAARDAARGRAACQGGQGHGTRLRHRGRTAGAARHRRRGAVPDPLPSGLAGGPQCRRPQRPDVGADQRRASGPARPAAARGDLVRRAAGARRTDHRGRTGHRLRDGGLPAVPAARLRGDRDGVLLLPAVRQARRRRAGTAAGHHGRRRRSHGGHGTAARGRPPRPADGAARPGRGTDRRGVRGPGRGRRPRRPAGRAQPGRDRGRPSVLLGGRRWTTCRSRRPARPCWSRTRTRCCCPER